MDANLRLDDAEITAALRRLQEITSGRASDTMRRIANFMLTAARMRFRTQQGPDGQRWAQSARARRQGGQTLRDTNRLFQSLTWRSGAGFAEVGTNVPYAAAHQHGVNKQVTVPAHRRMLRRSDTTRRTVSIRSVMVKSHQRRMRLPARPFFGWGAADRARILAMLQEGIERVARP